MKNISKSLFREIEEETYGCFIAHFVLYTTFEKAQIKKPNEEIPNEIALHIYFAAKNPSDLVEYGKIIENKITQEIGDNSDGSNEVVVAHHDPKRYYCVVAYNVDYNSQEIIQPDFSIRNYIQNSDLHSLARKNYLHYYSNVMKEIMKFGVYDNKEEFQDHYFEDMVKAQGLQKESVLKEDISPDKYCFQVRTISIHEISADHEKFADYSIRFAAKDAYAGGRYEEIIKEKISKEFNISEKSGEERASVFCAWPNYFYSAIVEEINFDDQDILQEDDSIRDHIKNNYLNGKSIDRDKYNVPFKLTMGGLYTDKLLDIIEFGVYEKEEDFINNYFEDMVKLSELEQGVEECCCCGGMGGVTTASFAPAVTHTVYPRPGGKKKKKKKSKKEDFDTSERYWPEKDDETDAFEKMIVDARQAKKDKIIARKEKAIEKRNQTVKDWLARVGDTMDLVKMADMFNKYNKVTNKMIVELERIKKLPLDSPEFF